MRFSCAAWVACFLAILALGLPTRGVHASILGSPHDLYRHGYIQVPEEKLRSNPQCDQCHISPPEDRPQIWKATPPSLVELGETGILCASCHDGVSMVEANVDAGLTVFHPLSHGLNPSLAPSETKFENTGLPRPDGPYFSCLTCHDPHEQAIRPFLRVPLQGLCTRCHKDRKAQGPGILNSTGDHPVDMEPFDKTGGPSPIVLKPFFNLAFPKDYPPENGVLSTNSHWTVGGHLDFGSYGQVRCTTCHALHGSELDGPVKNLLAKDPVGEVSDEFCEGCHQGERGDKKDEPPFPNPGGTRTGRTYHPVDDDEANGLGWNVAIADTVELTGYSWGGYDDEVDLPRLLCTTCHQAHNGIINSPALVKISDSIKRDKPEISTFCEVCHREAPRGHHAYNKKSATSSNGSTTITVINTENLGLSFGSPEAGKIYCSSCHRAHNAGYGGVEADYIPLLIFQDSELCSRCHELGVSHFLGDATLPSTFSKESPPLKRDPWPSGFSSSYDGESDNPKVLTCLSCHVLTAPGEGQTVYEHLLLAPAGEEYEWEAGYPEYYLCTGCHGEAPATVGEGPTHPLMEADATLYESIKSDHLLTGEYPVTYTLGLKINCHTCHVAHEAILPGGVYILKIGRGENIDPKAIHPILDYANLCFSCHPYL